MIGTDVDFATIFLTEYNLETNNFENREPLGMSAEGILEKSLKSSRASDDEIETLDIVNKNNELNSIALEDTNLNSQTTKEGDLLNGSSAGIVNLEANFNNFGTTANNVAAPILVKSNLEPTVRQLSKNFVSYNVVSFKIDDWNSKQLADRVDLIAGDRLLRLPGGTTSNYWDWKRGGPIEDTSLLAEDLPTFLQYQARSYTKGTLDNFNSLLSSTNTQPVWVLNMLTSTLEDQLEMLRTAKQKGMSVEHIELGNEFYFPINNYKQSFPYPADYAKEASIWIDAIKKEFPEAKIGVLGKVPEAGPTGKRIETWNQALVDGKTIDRADAITLHFYINNGLSSKIAPKQTYPYFQANEVATVLGEPFRKWEEFLNTPQYQLIPEDRSIWVTEYNLIENNKNQVKEQRIEGSWAHAMFVTAMGLQFLEDPRIEFANLHSLSGSSQFSALFQDNNSFRHPDLANINTTPYGLSAIGEAFRLFGTATENSDKAQKIDFVNSPILTGKDGFQYPALYGMKFTGQLGSPQALIMNLSDKPIQINADRIGFTNVKYDQIHGDPRTLVNNSDAIERKLGNSNGIVTLMPYSITKLSAA